MTWLVAVVALAGCNLAFGISEIHPRDAPADTTADTARDGTDPADDIDGDGVPDGIDPCFAPKSDALADLDNDTIPNGMDGCPLDAGPLVDVDADGDGIPDACDPFPTQDTQRCVMAFTSASFNATFWLPHGTDPSWDNGTGSMSTHGGNATPIMVAALPVEAPGRMTSYDAYIRIGDAATTVGNLTLWLRQAPDVLAMTDVGCIFFATGTSYSYGIFRNGFQPGTRTLVAPPPPFTIRMRASLTPPGPNGMSTIRCSVTPAGQARSADVTADLPVVDGRQGFSAFTWTVALLGLDVIAD